MRPPDAPDLARFYHGDFRVTTRLQDKILGALLPERRILALEGPRAEQVDFLNALVSNDVRRATQDRPVYAALLTPQGKYLADFLIFEGAGGNLRLDAEAGQIEDLLKRLTMYRLRRPLKLRVEEDQGVAAFWGEGAKPGLADPRDPALGTRLYGALPALEAALAQAEPGDYDAHRLALGIPASGRDLISGEGYILEAGFERLHGVDFRKGCYVGQEIVARMKHKTELRKGLARVRVEGEAPEGAEIRNAEGKPAGILRSHLGGVGLADLRFDRAEGLLTTPEGAVVRLEGP